MIRTIHNVMSRFACSQETAQRYCDLRDEGYNMEQAKLMAGLSDPPEETKMVWERIVSYRLHPDGCVWVLAAEADLIAALGPRHGFHKTSISIANCPSQAIDYQLPQNAAKLAALFN